MPLPPIEGAAIAPAGWAPDSWRRFPAEQQPAYADAAAIAEVVRQLAELPPLVTSWEVEALKGQLAAAAEGRAFLLQGGDCAESFEDCTSAVIANKLIRVGRFAGQYAKPRSADLEDQGGVALPAYRGDLINRTPFTAHDRAFDPQLLLRGYERAALTLNFIRALVDGGFADLHHPEYWDLDFVQHSPLAEDYRRIVAGIVPLTSLASDRVVHAR